LGWHRDLIRKGMREVEQDRVCVDAVKLRGRRRTESRLPNLLADLKSIWNGDILDEIETVVRFAETMTWNGRHPVVQLVTKNYHTGVKLAKSEMAEVETKIQRLTCLEVNGLRLEAETISRIIRRDVMRESVTYQAILEEGREEGRREQGQATAITLLQAGIPIDLIANASGLSIAEVI
jgi:hypothetical protein